MTLKCGVLKYGFLMSFPTPIYCQRNRKKRFHNIKIIPYNNGTGRFMPNSNNHSRHLHILYWENMPFNLLSINRTRKNHSAGYNSISILPDVDETARKTHL